MRRRIGRRVPHLAQHCARFMLFWALIGTAFATRVKEGLIAEGTRWETPFTVVDSERPGPTVLVTGGVHGNEPAGARAAEQISHWPVTRGRMAIIPRCNVPGLKESTRNLPGVPETLSNLNRDFPTGSNAEAPRGEPAKSIWAFVTQVKPDYMLDLHEGYGVRGNGSKSVGSSVIRARHKNAEAIQRLLLNAVNAEVSDPDERFVPLKGTAKGALAGACAEQLGTCAFICETTSSKQNLSLRVRQHRIMVHALLSHLDMVSVPPHCLLPPRGKSPGRIRIAIYDGPGAGSPLQLEGLLTAKNDMRVCPIHPADIRDGALDAFDVVIFPGGGGSKQAEGLAPEGRRIVETFVREGGGYLGICAGAYLATSHYAWSLSLINADSLDTRHWRRGSAMLKMELTATGAELFDRPAGRVMEISFRQGPILGPGGRKDLPAYDVCAWFRTGVGKNGADPKTMVDTPAIIRGPYGRGRVVVFSPHPEKTDGLHDFIPRAVRWCRATYLTSVHFPAGKSSP